MEQSGGTYSMSRSFSSARKCYKLNSRVPFGIRKGVTEWEQDGRQPESAARAYLTVIAKNKQGAAAHKQDCATGHFRYSLPIGLRF